MCTAKALGFISHANCEGPDQPARERRLIRAFAVRQAYYKITMLLEDNDFFFCLDYTWANKSVLSKRLKESQKVVA